MALLCLAHPSQFILGFYRPKWRSDTVLKLGLNVPPTPLNFRFKNSIRLHVCQKFLLAFASNINPLDKNSLKEESDGIKTSDAAQGPPFLTILAGFLVFLVICWIIGSILIWLIGLVVHLPPSK